MAKDMYQKREERKKKALENNENNGVNKSVINWFPGHMVKAINEIKNSMKYIDIVCVILDSRIPDSSKNDIIFELSEDKPCIIVFNKYDLADENKLKEHIKKYENKGYVTVCTNANLGIGIDKIEKAIKDIGSKTKYVSKTSKEYEVITPIYRVLISGIPNVGKSTIINKLSGKKSANVGNKPGVTKSKQWIRLDDNIELMDTPGVLWPKLGENDAGIKLALTGNIKEEVVDVEDLALRLIDYLKMDEKYFSVLVNRYGLDKLLDENNYPISDISQLQTYELLELIGKSRGAIIKGGEVDFNKISKILIDEFKSGKIGRINLE